MSRKAVPAIVQSVARIEDRQIALLSKGRALVLSVKTVKQARTYAAQAEAVALYTRKAGLSDEIQAEAVELKLRFERKAGELLREMPKAKAGRHRKIDPKPGSIATPTFKDQGLDHHDAHRYQKLAAVPEATFERRLAEVKEAGDRATVTTVLNGGAHVGKNTGESEWYTPVEYVDAAREVMGGIDLDPASCAAANEILKIDRFYDAALDGLKQPWTGRIWMNPPYVQPAISEFSSRLTSLVESGDVVQACALVNNATETEWFQKMLGAASAICFPRGRVRFWHPERGSAAPLQGQAVIYFGAEAGGFCRRFASFGFVARPVS